VSASDRDRILAEFNLGPDDLLRCSRCGEEFKARKVKIVAGWHPQCPTTGCEGSPRSGSVRAVTAR